jgi:hypothetical protein
MVIIVDDTFSDRYKYQDVNFLKETRYSDVCTVYSVVKTIDLASLVKQLVKCELFCNHKTLQLFNTEGKALNIEDNSKNRETLINMVTQLGVPRIEFSRGLETNYEANRIDKDLFYSNLKPFLDYFIVSNSIETKVLFWGESFKNKKRLSIIQNMMNEIRITNVEDFQKNSAIREGLYILYPQLTIEQIIEEWVSRQFNKNEVIQDINNQI